MTLPGAVSVRVPELPTAVRAANLVPGDPADLELLAAELRRFAQGAAHTVAGLHKLTLGDWQGEAARAFAHELGEAPKRLERAAEAFGAASRALSLHAQELRDAQDRVTAAIGLWRHAQARATVAGAAAVPAGVLPLEADPLARDRFRAEDMVLNARADAEASGRRLAAVLDDLADLAPDKPGLLSSVLGALGSFGAGALEATAGLAEFVYKLSPAYQVIDPEGYAENLETLGQGLAFGITHPAEFGKAMLDVQTWKDDPARALGHLVPDLLLALATAGGGAAARGVTATRAAGRAGETVGSIRRTVDLLEDTGQVAWRGKGLDEGLTLGARDNLAADAFRGWAAEAEQSLSPRIGGLMERHGGDPYGWEYRLKGEDSLKRKLATALEESPGGGLHPVDALEGIRDNVRYTAGFDEADFAAKSREMAEALRADGFTEVKFRNTFGADGYQGINSNWRDPVTGHVFELQFHTPASFEAKSVTHGLYEEARIPGTPPERVAELNRQQDGIFDAVPRPSGASGVASPSDLPTLNLPAGLAAGVGSQSTAALSDVADRAAEEGR